MQLMSRESTRCMYDLGSWAAYIHKVAHALRALLWGVMFLDWSNVCCSVLLCY
jgi:hypothetical protein